MAGARYGYRPQIDGLRALAVLGVLLNHFWFPHGPMGLLGVRLFFVISGFLITERLLDARTTIEGGASRPISEGLAFFLRRALRLFPAYYLLLTLLLITNAGDIRASAPWHLFNLTNFWFVKIDDWSPWMIAHFWSATRDQNRPLSPADLRGHRPQSLPAAALGHREFETAVRYAKAAQKTRFENRREKEA